MCGNGSSLLAVAKLVSGAVKLFEFMLFEPVDLSRWVRAVLFWAACSCWFSARGIRRIKEHSVSQSGACSGEWLWGATGFGVRTGTHGTAQRQNSGGSNVGIGAAPRLKESKR